VTTRGRNGTGSVFQRSDGRWTASIRYKDANGQAKRRTVYGKTRREALDRLKEVQRHIDAGAPVVESKDSVAAFVERWITTVLEVSDKRPTTIATYRTIARTKVLPHLGPLPLAALDRATISRWYADLRTAGVAVSTIHKAADVLGMALDEAVEEGLLRRNPVRLVDRPALVRAEAETYTSDEVARLNEAAKGSREFPLLVLAAHTGMRKGEALGLRWRDVRLDRREIAVTGTLVRVGGRLTRQEPKTNAGTRVIPLSPAAIAALDEARSWQDGDREGSEWWSDTGYVFTTSTGEPMDPRNVLRWFARIKRAAKVRHGSWHTLRHAFASHLLGSGASMFAVSRVLGHARIGITMDVYGHLAPADMRDQVIPALDGYGAPDEGGNVVPIRSAV